MNNVNDLAEREAFEPRWDALTREAIRMIGDQDLSHWSDGHDTVTLHALRASMATIQRPAEQERAPFGVEGLQAPDWMRKKANAIAEDYAAKGRITACRADIIEAMQASAIAAAIAIAKAGDSAQGESK